MKIFNQLQRTRIPRNKFDLSHERKLSANMGKLIPIMVEEVVPGDTIRAKSEILLRLAPMLAPMMHRVNVYTHYFFVPNRLVWSEWEDFITGGRLGVTAPAIPTATMSNTYSSNFQKGTLADYMGLPEYKNSTTNLAISVLPFRAYQLIYNEYYRDQVLEAPIDFLKTSGAIAPTEYAKLFTLRDRAWEKDYLTSARPNAQLGSEVTSPINTTVNYLGVSQFKTSAGATPTANTLIGSDGSSGQNLRVNKPAAGSIGTDGRIENISSVNSTLNINDLRRSVRLQEWLEKNARAGARYIEQILSHFGVMSSDARLQRPEYLGGGMSPVMISEVLQTAEDPAGLGNPLATMAGHGISVGDTNQFTRKFEEHGYVIGIMSVLPRTAYQQGVPRHFTRQDKLDYYWPEFSQIGEQAIKNKEVFFDGSAGNPDDTWGYQSRYAEYKFSPSTVHGDFRDNLNFWHMGRIFTALPPLNDAFVRANPTTRVFAVEDPAIHKLWVQVYNKVDALRPMPYFGTPTI